MIEHQLLEHHLHFLSTHRGSRESLQQVEYIKSEKSAFNIAFPLSKASIETISSSYNIYLPDWVLAITETIPARKKTGSITYMNLPEPKNNWKTNGDVIVKKVTTLADIEDFSLVQGKGFNESEKAFNELYPWIREKNIHNFKDTNQEFYVAYKNEKPVGVCLGICHHDIVGIYAVATLPENRKHGISTSLMKQLIEDGIKNNMATFTLQVATNSYAHSFYRHLGFKDVFECSILATTN